MSVTTILKEVQTAMSEESAANAEALRRGQADGGPLTESRLGELCELGERMIRAATRRERAVLRLREIFATTKGGH